LSDVSALAFDPSRGLFVAGTEPHLIAVARLNADGSLDPSFGSGGIASTGVGSTDDVFGVDGLAIDPSRGLVVAATTAPLTSSTYYRPVVTRFDFHGNLDSSFNNGAVEFFDFQPPRLTDNHARAVAVQPDGKVLLAGTSQKVAPGGVTLFALARLNPDGTRDTNFEFVGETLIAFLDPNLKWIDSISHSVLVQPDGNILVTGSAGLADSSFALARFLGSGGALVTPQPPRVGAITTPGRGVLAGTTAVVSASFIYNIPSDQHTAVWNWGDGTTSTGNVTEANGQGSVTGSHVYAAVGVYQVTLTVTDQRGASGSATAIPGVAVFIPITGGITGRGQIISPLGAFRSTPTLAGKAAFRFRARAAPNSTISGKLALKFKAGRLSFKSTRLNWLTVSGNILRVEASGSIDGAGSYVFLVSARIANRRSTKIRIQVWNQPSGALVYDSQPGASASAAPATPIRSGTITVHLATPRRRPAAVMARETKGGRSAQA
jgi:uncharacterized delta-60 repeat protein